MSAYNKQGSLGKSVIDFNLSTQWCSRRGGQVGTRASEHSHWRRINLHNSAI